jgi:WD40 repeat protein
MKPADCRLEREWKVGSPLIGCRFDPSGRFLFATAQDSTVRRLDLITGQQTTLAGHQSWARGIAFTPPAAKPVPLIPPPPKPEPFTTFVGDYSGKLVWWPGDAAAPAPTRTVAAHDGWVRAVAASPDGKTVATCGNDNLVRLWSAADGALVRTLAGHDCHVYNLAFSPDGTRLVSADLKGIVKDWDLRTGAVVRDLDAKVLNFYDPTFMAKIGGARGLVFSADGSRLAAAGIANVSNAFAGVGSPLVLVFGWADGKSKQFKPKDAFQGTAWGVVFHPSGHVIAAGGALGAGRIWFWAGEEAVSTHTVNVPANARDLALHPAGERLALAGANGVAYVYTLAPPLTFVGPPEPMKK